MIYFLHLIGFRKLQTNDNAGVNCHQGEKDFLDTQLDLEFIPIPFDGLTPTWFAAIHRNINLMEMYYDIEMITIYTLCLSSNSSR